MVPASHVLAFAGLAAVLIAIPGPSVLFTISRALTVGRRSALLTVAGNELGGLMQVAAVAFGVGALVERSAEVFTVVKLAGAAYLVYLGVQAIRHRRSMAEALAARVTPVRPLRAIRDGFVVGVTNPKSVVFFVVALPGESAGPGADADPWRRVPRHRARHRQRVGGRCRYGPPVARAIAAAAGDDRRHRRPGDDRPRCQHRRNR